MFFSNRRSFFIEKRSVLHPCPHIFSGCTSNLYSGIFNNTDFTSSCLDTSWFWHPRLCPIHCIESGIKEKTVPRAAVNGGHRFTGVVGCGKSKFAPDNTRLCYINGCAGFILFDSMLVVNRYKQYKQSFPLANGFILASYCIAQSCIVYGIE